MTQLDSYVYVHTSNCHGGPASTVGAHGAREVGEWGGVQRVEGRQGSGLPLNNQPTSTSKIEVNHQVPEDLGESRRISERVVREVQPAP